MFKRLEEMLAHDPKNSRNLQENALFEPSREPSLVRDLPVGLPDDPVDRAIQVFCRMALLFECGLMLESDGAGKWTPRALFRKGQARPMRSDLPSITLPKVSPLQALKAPSTSFLQNLDLADLDPEGRCGAYLMQPTPEFAFVVFSALPDLWLKDHLNRVISSLADSFSQ